MVIIDLPFPVSVNHVWRFGKKKAYRSKRYMMWLQEAHGNWLIQKPHLGDYKIKGHYSLSILLNPPDNRNRDLGNLEKILSDFAQSAGIIENDHLCRRLVIEYGSRIEAPLGARLTFTKVIVPSTIYREMLDKLDEL